MDEVLDNLLLAIHRDRTPAGELVQVDTIAAPAEAQLDPMVDRPLPLHAFPEAGLRQKVDRAVLQHPRSHRRLQLVAGADLKHHRLDALQV